MKTISAKRQGSVILGLVVSLVIGVGVYFAYQANRGLPGSDSYRLTAEVHNAASLTRGNEVRIGGVRAGVVDAIKAKRLGNGGVIASLELKLNSDVHPLPKDSTLIIRPKSTLGLKYVDITRGKSDVKFANGATIPRKSARPQPVEFDQVLGIFDEKTREGVKTNIVGMGDGLASRGKDINSAIGDLRPLLPKIESVSKTLSSPETRLGQTFMSLARAAATVAPVARSQAEMIVNMNRTFAFISSQDQAYRDALRKTPEALSAGIDVMPVTRRFLANSQALVRELRPGIQVLRRSGRDLAAGLETGTPMLGEAVGFNRRLIPVFRSVRKFGEDPQVGLGLDRLTDTSRALDPTLRYITPAQTVCNYMTQFFGNIASVVSEGDGHGTWQRFIIVASPEGPNSEAGPAVKPAAGPAPDNYLHINPYPFTAAPGQPIVCEAGTEKYRVGQTVTTNTAAKR